MPRSVKPVKPRAKQVAAGTSTPKTDSEKAFCAAWLQHYDVQRAHKEAGFSGRRVPAERMFKSLERYLVKQKERKETAVSRELVIEQKDILEEMVAIGFANPQDYIVQVAEQIKDEKTGAVTTVVRSRQRPIMELTRRQAAAISKVMFHPDGTVTYELPDDRAKHPYLRDLGQHIGLFHPKLIQEHRHKHAIAMLDLRDMDAAKLAQAEQFFMSALGNEGRRMLNLFEGEFENVSED